METKLDNVKYTTHIPICNINVTVSMLLLRNINALTDIAISQKNSKNVASSVDFGAGSQSNFGDTFAQVR